MSTVAITVPMGAVATRPIERDTSGGNNGEDPPGALWLSVLHVLRIYVRSGIRAVRITSRPRKVKRRFAVVGKLS